MENDQVKSLVAELSAKLEAATIENGKLRKLNNDCRATVENLVAKVEDLSERAAVLSSPPLGSVGTAYRKRPPVMRGRTVQVNVGCGPLYITLNEDDDGKPFEVFFKLGKSGSCQQSYLESLGVVMSVGLRYGADPQKFVDKLAGMRCPNPRTKLQNAGKPATLSCADGISQGLALALTLALPGTEPASRMEADVVAVAEPLISAPQIDLVQHDAVLSRSAYGNGHGSTVNVMATGAGMCPKCSGPLIYQSGCTICQQECGYEKCT